MAEENEYPKWLYLSEGNGMLVQDAEEEATARAAGFGDLVGGTAPGGELDTKTKPKKAKEA